MLKLLEGGAHIALIDTGIHPYFAGKYYKFLFRKVEDYAVEDPEKSVKLAYLAKFNHLPDLKNPKTINEKLQVLKLGEYYDNPSVTECIDK